MVQPSASSRLQLRPLRSQAYPQLLCFSARPREWSLRRTEGWTHHVHQNAQLHLLRHHELFGPRHHVRQVGQDVWCNTDQVLASIRVF